MGQKTYTLKDDLMFKLIFYSSTNEHILKEFLQDILGTKVDSVEIQNPYNIRSVADDETSQRLVYTAVDIVAKIQNGTSIIIELQIESTPYFTERILYYWGERFNTNYAQTKKKDSKYQSLKPVYIICILDYVMFPNDQDLRRTFHIYDEEHQYILQDDETPYLKLVFIELPKIKGNVPPPLVDWVSCIEYGRVGEQAKEVIKEVIRLVNEKNETKEVDKLETLIEKLQEESEVRGIEKGKEIGLEEGRIKGRIEGLEEGLEKAALNLKKLGAPLEQIQQATGLSNNRISQL